jgi:hypothetical protein
MHYILVIKPGRKRSLEISSLRWEDNIKIDLRERGFGGTDWISLALVNTVINLRVP